MLVSSGAIAAGLAPLGLKRRPRALPAQQAAASVGQGLLVHRYTEELARHGVVAGQVLLTLDDVTRRSHYRNAYQTFAKLLELGVLPIVNENDTVATTEIRFGDNDRLAALVAHLVHADLLVLLSDVDGLYDGDPGAAGSALVTDVRVRRRPRPGARSARPARPASAPAGCRPRSRRPGSRPAPASPSCSPPPSAPRPRSAGEPVGTLFHADRPAPADPAALAGARHRAARHPAARRRRGPRGHPAPRLAARRRASPACSGTFVAGDPVDIAGPDGVAVARGLVNFDAAELPGLLGRSSHDLKRELGAAYEREVVHRDDLVLL